MDLLSLCITITVSNILFFIMGHTAAIIKYRNKYRNVCLTSDYLSKMLKFNYDFMRYTIDYPDIIFYILELYSKKENLNDKQCALILKRTKRDLSHNLIKQIFTSFQVNVSKDNMAQFKIAIKEFWDLKRYKPEQFKITANQIKKTFNK